MSTLLPTWGGTWHIYTNKIGHLTTNNHQKKVTLLRRRFNKLVLRDSVTYPVAVLHAAGTYIHDGVVIHIFVPCKLYPRRFAQGPDLKGTDDSVCGAKHKQ